MTDGERAIIETKSQAARESAEAAMLADMDDKPTLDELPGLLAVELATVGRALSSVSRNIICGILDDAVGRAKAAEDERDALRAELEAQQAAQQWRPVTEKPDRDDMYQIVEFLNNGALYSVGDAHWRDGQWTDHDDLSDATSMTHYRPIPDRVPGAAAQ